MVWGKEQQRGVYYNEDIQTSKNQLWYMSSLSEYFIRAQELMSRIAEAGLIYEKHYSTHWS